MARFQPKSPRPETREVPRPGLKRGEAMGRDGEIIRRHRDDNMDPFHIELSDIPDNYTYEWKRLSVTGKYDRANLHRAGHAGWKPVPATRHPGRWHPEDYDGAIEFEGMGLFERPRKLTLEAREDDAQAAASQLAEARGDFKFNSPDSSRYDANTPQAQRHTMLKSEVVGSPTALYPNLQIGDDE